VQLCSCENVTQVENLTLLKFANGNTYKIITYAKKVFCVTKILDRNNYGKDILIKTAQKRI